MSFARRTSRSRKLAVAKNVDVDKLAEAARALSHVAEVKQLNDLLGVARQIEPMFNELRSVCAMLIQEKLVLERKIERLESVIPQLAYRLPAIPGGENLIREQFARLCAEWDEANPMVDVEVPEEIQSQEVVSEASAGGVG